MAEASLLASRANSPETTSQYLTSHVLAEIARTCGPQLACPKSGEIISAFWDRFGETDGLIICDYVFGPLRGMWRGAPVTPLRFQAHQDDFFARPVLAEAGGTAAT